MKIDFHVHTKEGSSCGRSSAEDQIRAAIAAGLDALVFTDHDRLFPDEMIRRFNAQYAPFHVFSGIEKTLNGEHLLIIGVHDAIIENPAWSYPELYAFIRKHEGFLTLAHPFRFNARIEIDLERFLPDAIEAYSNNIPPSSEPRLLSLAEGLGVNVLSNSDAHHKNMIGSYYNVFADAPADERELVAMLRAGQYACVSPEKTRASSTN